MRRPTLRCDGRPTLRRRQALAATGESGEAQPDPRAHSLRAAIQLSNPGPAVADPEGNMAATEPEDSDPALNPDLPRGSTARLSQMGDDKIAQLCAKYDKDGNGKFDVDECAAPSPAAPRDVASTR